ncbi:gamma-glutamyltransferase, partial [Conexibacter sp. CPCC 205706]|uniref:gamma-glutamyltransferase n=1 Tax=Conexibacter sp. CPCC 205706 TaxID=3064572 RepID=UPI002724BD95
AGHLRRAAALARDGVPVAPGLARAIEARAPQIAADPGLSALLTPGGRALTSDDTLVQPALAATLETIATDGPGSFYGGAVGAALVGGMQAAGSAMTLADLALHRAEQAAPLSAELLGATWHVAPPPSAGITLLAMLDGLDGDRLPLQRARDAAAARDRFLGDPRRGPLDLAALRAADPAGSPRATAAS